MAAATVADNYKAAIEKYGTDAKTAFDSAAANVQNNQPRNSDDPQQKEDRKKALKDAQGAMAAAFSQLGTAARMASEQTGREGYADVVALMHSTAVTAESVCHQVRLAMSSGAAANFQYLDRLAAILAALAQLSPAAAWEQLSEGQD